MNILCVYLFLNRTKLSLQTMCTNLRDRELIQAHQHTYDNVCITYDNTYIYFGLPIVIIIGHIETGRRHGG